LKQILALLIVLSFTLPSRADFWGGDLPLLAHIVTNTLNTLMELQKQSQFMKDEMDGVKDKIDRIQTISELVQPSSWDKWRDPMEAMTRLQRIYQAVPKEYRTEKSDMIEDEISKAMNLVARISRDTQHTFESGKELERRGADASPGVASKLTASGVGTLISMQAQSQVLQSQVTSLLSQMLASANEKETRGIVSKGATFHGVSSSLGLTNLSFSKVVLGMRDTP
jgi:hypothetical protein